MRVIFPIDTKEHLSLLASARVFVMIFEEKGI